MIKTAALVLAAGLSQTAYAAVVSVPSSPVPAISVRSVAISGLPTNPPSSPFNNPSASLPLSPSLSPLPSPLPSALIPSRAVAYAAATSSFPDAPEPLHAVRSLNNFWDGLGVSPLDLDEPAFGAETLAGIVEDGIGEAERLAPWLATDDPKIAAALDRAVSLARATRAGRRALDEAERVLAEQGRALPVLVMALGRNFGEYDYLEKTMRLHKDLFRAGRETELAGTIVHELTHVVQHSFGVPANSLEMEIEAHLQDLDMLAELDLKPPKGTFARQALDLLAKGPERFIELIQAAIPGAVFLGGSSLEEIEDQLEEDLADQRKRAKRSKTAAGLIPVIERDLARLRTPEGEAAYHAFSKRVLALLRRRAADAR